MMFLYNQWPSLYPSIVQVFYWPNPISSPAWSANRYIAPTLLVAEMLQLMSYEVCRKQKSSFLFFVLIIQIVTNRLCEFNLFTKQRPIKLAVVKKIIKDYLSV